MSDVRLDWASAEVSDGKLTVPLEGEVPKDWKESFERTLHLLGDGDWGAIELKKEAVRVAQVAPGTEEKLRHHLEAIVAQANAAGERAEDTDHSDEDADGPDAEMTARFRAFAEDTDAA
jgi:hypothetical protein